MAGLDELILKVDIQTTGSNAAIKDIQKLEDSFENAEKGSIEYEQALKNLQTAQRATGQSSKVLAKSINDLEKEQKELIDTQNKLIKQGQTNSDAFKKNSSSLQSNQNQLSKLRGETTKTGTSFGNMGKGVKGLSGNLGGMAKVGGVAVTAIIAIGTALQKAYDYISPLEQRFNKLQGTISRFSKISGDDLRDATSQVASLGQTFDLTDEDIIQAAQSLQKNSDSVKTFGDALNLIEKGLLAGANSNGEFLDSLKEYPVALKSAGIEGENLIKILTVGATGGFFSDKLVDSIKEAELSLKEFDKAQEDALKPLGDTFVKNFKKDIEAGVKDVPTLLMDIQKQAELAGLSTAEYQKLTADILKGAGEDAGGFKNVVNALTEAYSLNLDELDNLGKSQKNQLDIQKQLTEEQTKFAENFKGLTSAMSNLASVAETEVLSILNQFLDWFDSAEEKLNDFKNNLKEEEITLNVGTGVTEDFTYGMRNAQTELDITKKKLAELKAQGEGGIFSSLDEDIERTELELQQAQATLDATKNATEQYKIETAKTTEILKKLDAQLANEKDANKRAETLAKMEAIQGRTVKTLADRKKVNEDLTNVLGKQTTKVKDSEDAIKKRKKAIDDQNKALEKWRDINQSLQNELAQSRIAVDKDVFGIDTLNQETNLAILKLNQDFEKDLAMLQETAKKGRISNSELEASIKARAEILSNEILLIETEAQRKREEAQIKAVQSYFDQVEQAKKAQKELTDFINEGLESEEEDELFLSKEDLNKEIANIKSLTDFYLSEIDLAESEGNKKRKEAEKERIEIRKEALRKEIALLEEAGASITEINQKQTELNLLGKNGEKQGLDFAQSFEQGATAVFSVFDSINNAQNELLNQQIAKQEERVAKAEKLAENGNTKALEREQKRLDELEKKRETAAKRQQALALAEAAANTIVAITQAATTPFPANLAAITATIASIAGAIPLASSLFSGAFADGIVDFKGKGTETSDSNPVLISNRESIITAKGTKNAPNLLKAINKGQISDNDIIANTALMQPITTVQSPDFSQLNDRLESVEKGLQDVVNAINEKPVSSFSSRITKSGIENITTTQQKKIKLINNRR